MCTFALLEFIPMVLVSLETPAPIFKMNNTVYQIVTGGSDYAYPVDNLTANMSQEDDAMAMLSDIVGIWITGLCCLLGLAGNILSFLVLLQAHSHSPMFLVLRAIAVSDGLFLLSVFILMTLVNINPYISICNWCHVYRGYIQFSVWPIMMMTQMSTVWLTVLVSLERYIAICFPLRSSSICTISKVRKAVILIFIVSIIYNIPRYFEFEVSSNEEINKTSIGTQEIYRYLYSGILYSLTLFFIPLLSLIFLNVKLILAIKEGKKQWETLQFRQRKEQNLTIIPLTIVLVFFICGVPALAVNVIDSINPYLMDQPWYLVFLVIANLLVVLNSACNFIIYCLLGKKFRTKLLQMCRCQCSRYRVVQMSMTQQSDYYWRRKSASTNERYP